MPPRIGLSKSKLLSYLQCPRRAWLETYSPELEEPGRDAAAARATGRAVGAVAREVYGHGAGHHVSSERGLRGAIETTHSLLAAGGSEPIFEASFDYDGVVAQIDILERNGEPRIVEVKASTQVAEHHFTDCSIQAWILRESQIPVRRIVIANVDREFAYPGEGRYDGLFKETDVTDEVGERLASVPDIVAQARATLTALDEPETPIGKQCLVPHECPFFAHCAPPQDKYPVTGIGGSKEKQFALMNAGFRDLRDVPETELGNDLQRRIWRQTKAETPIVDEALREAVRGLPFPRYYLDFETIGFAVPIWPDTHPYEALPFQWSCHVEAGPRRGNGRLRHAEFLDLSGQAPMRAAAESLLEALGAAGPVIVYTTYEAHVLKTLAARYADLAEPLDAVRARLVDLHPWLKQHYYHPAMLGSWSIKAVLPTVAPDLRYDDSLGEVQNGNAAQAAYLEAIAPETSASRRGGLDEALRRYCRHDTLALARLVEFFST
jgi:Domain of unknown function(DUF2779)